MRSKLQENVQVYIYELISFSCLLKRYIVMSTRHVFFFLVSSSENILVSYHHTKSSLNRKKEVILPHGYKLNYEREIPLHLSHFFCGLERNMNIQHGRYELVTL